MPIVQRQGADGVATSRFEPVIKIVFGPRAAGTRGSVIEKVLPLASAEVL